MSLSIGTLVGYLQLDDTNFARKADAADKKMSGLQLQLKALSQLDPKLKINVDETNAKIDALKAKIADLKVQAASGLDVRVDMVKALTELDILQAKIREASRAVVIPVEVTGWATAMSKLAALNGLANKAGSKIPTWLTLVAAIAPAMTVVGGAATLGFGAFTSGALTAAAGVGVLHLALMNLAPAAAAFQAYQSSLTGAQQGYGTALSKAGSAHAISLAAATTPAGRIRANSTFAKAQANAAASYAQARSGAQATLNQSAYGSMSPQGRSFVQFDLTKLKPAGTQLQQSAQTAALPGIQAGLTQMLRLAPLANGAVAKIGGAIGDMADKAGAALNKPFWRNWITWLGNSTARDLPLIGSGVGHFIEGFARAIKKFSPDGQSMLQWFDSLAKRFDHWTTTDGFTKFLDTIRGDAASVGQFFKTAGPVLGEFMKGIAQAGTGELSALSGVFKALGSFPPGVITALGHWLPVVLLAIKGMQIVTSVADGVRTLGVAMGFLDAAMDANPIGLVILAVAALAAGFIYAYKHSETFRDIVDGVFATVGRVANAMWKNLVQPALKGMAEAWLIVVGILVNGAAKAFGWVPGLGPKLRKAASDFGVFALKVQNAIDGIDGTINIKFKVANLVTPAKLKDSVTGADSALPGRVTHGSSLADLVGQVQNGTTTTGNGSSSHHTVTGSAPRAGVSINIGTLQAHDYNDFMKQAQRRKQMAAIGGVG